MTTAWALLGPLDVVEFRDGRPFTATLASAARTTFPRPTSTAGAVGAAFGTEPSLVGGPVLARRGPGGRWRLLFPCPGDVLAEGRKFRLARAPHPPGPSSVTTDLDDLEGAPTASHPVDARGDSPRLVLDTAQLESYLAGEVGFLDSMSVGDGWYVLDRTLRAERRTGLARAGRVARAGFLYTAEYLRFDEDDGFAFACQVDFGDRDVPASQPVVRLGGEARQASVAVLPASDERAPRMPRPLAEFPGGRVLVYLATPAVFDGGWRPDDLGGGHLVSATIGGFDVAASWLTGRRSAQPLRWAVPAGSVYQLEFDDELAAATFAQCHATCLPQADERLRTAGFGLCLIGRW